MIKITKIVLIGILSLVAQYTFAATFTTEFTTDANYTHDSEIEVSGGLAKLKGSSLWNGLQGYWKMDDVSGQITDSSGNGNHLTNHNASYGATGKLGGAMNFVENDYLDGGGSMMNMGLDDMTISSWFKTTDDNGIIVTKSFYSAEDERYALYFSGGYLRSLIDYGGEKRAQTLDDLYIDGNWHQAVVTFDRDGQMKLYVDGIEKSSVDISASVGVDFDKNNLFLMGRYNNSAGDGVHPSTLKFSGSIDETAIWNRALTPSEITELYNAGNGKEITQYSNGTFTISKTNGNSANSISQFTGFQITPGTLEGSLHFQLSTDGTNWKYWDGNTWTNAQTNNDTNTEAEVNTYISNFPTNTNSIYVKTFLTGDGTQRTEIDEINIQYETNNAPTDIKLNGTDSISIQEGTNTGTSIATLTTTDADAGDTHTYSLVNGTGDEDNAKFTISGTNLQLNFTPDFENPTDLGDTAGNNTYSIRIQTDDGNGGTYQKSFIITVTDVDENAPIISLLGSPVITLTQGDTYNDAGATAQDNEDGDITAHIIVVNPVDTNTPGTYTISYNVSDSAGNPAQEVTRTVIVKEKNKRGGSKRVSKKRLAEIFGRKEEIKKQEKLEGSEGIEEKETTCHINYHRLIKKGMKGEDVREVQECLLNKGFLLPQYGVDGWYGIETYQQITAYQKAQGLRYIDGIVGPETISWLNGKNLS